jgi:hypothetical protein
MMAGTKPTHTPRMMVEKKTRKRFFWEGIRGVVSPPVPSPLEKSPPCEDENQYNKYHGLEHA